MNDSRSVDPPIVLKTVRELKNLDSHGVKYRILERFNCSTGEIVRLEWTPDLERFYSVDPPIGCMMSEIQTNRLNQFIRAIMSQELEILIPKGDSSIKDKREATFIAQKEFQRLGWNGQRIIHTGNDRMSSGENAVNGHMTPWHVFETKIPFWRYKRAEFYWRIRCWITTKKAQKLFGIKLYTAINQFPALDRLKSGVE